MQTVNSLKEAFEELVAIKYQLYNSLFLTLPFNHLRDIGVELPMFAALCQQELAKGQSPDVIVEKFFTDMVHTENFAEQIKILFLMLQFVERQVVLFDSLEEAAFKKTHDFSAKGTLADFLNHLSSENISKEARELLKNYCVRIVLTAHPTQFYPFQILGIIEDLTDAIKDNNLKEIRHVLLQLGKTSFKNKTSPTPLDEAKILMHYLEQVFYPVMKNLQIKLNNAVRDSISGKNNLKNSFELGFWPGGDRDGNPNVTADITCQVARQLKHTILKLYIQDLQEIKRRLTFQGMWEALDAIINKLLVTQAEQETADSVNHPSYLHSEELIADLEKLKNKIITEQNGLFVEEANSIIMAAQLFGFYFATIDIRQNSQIHARFIQNVFETQKKFADTNYLELSEEKKLELLTELLSRPSISGIITGDDPVFIDVLAAFNAMTFIQKNNGEKGANRYIISNTQSASNLLEVMLLAQWAGLAPDALCFDIIPLFETIPDLKNAVTVMEKLYQLPIYQQHLTRRNKIQVVMLGFSDGTKDGGYITANWAIFRCKQSLFELSKKMGIQVIFFDGRGGPPARGGGETHLFYRAMDGIINQQQIQLTIQGQTISSKFGTKTSASYSIEQLFTSGLLGPLLHEPCHRMSEHEFTLIERLSTIGYTRYQQLKNHPLFGSYLENITPLNFFGDLNIASRPPRRKTKGELRFEDLRAIPFVSAWSLIKQNIPGYYGVGTSLQTLIEQGEEAALKHLFQHSLFFRTLLENAMQSLLKSNFSLTQYLALHPTFGAFWSMLREEADLSILMLKRISGQSELLASNPVKQRSIQIREQLILPLLVIQQYALLKRQDGQPKSQEEDKALYQLILKCIAANVNASRNSA